MNPIRWLVLLAGLAAPVSAIVGRWHSWSDLNPVKAMVDYQGRLYVGTTGGVRSIHPGTLEEKTFDNQTGLTDIRIVGFAVDADNRLWAASHSGQIFRLEGNRWSAWGRSYVAEGWTINDRSFLSVGDYLVIGSAKGLSFFDRKRGVAIANLTKFGREGVQSVTSLLRVGDTLFIATGKSVLQAAVDWEDVLSSRFRAIYDPQIWTQAAGFAAPYSLSFQAASSLGKRGQPALSRQSGLSLSASDEPPVDEPPVDTGTGGGGTGGDTTARIDSTEGRPVHLAVFDGIRVAHDTGTVLGGAIRVKALRNRLLVINGKTYVFSVENAIVSGGRLFLGAASGLWILSPQEGFLNIPPPLIHPDFPASAIAASHGTVIAQSANNTWRLSPNGWLPMFDFGPPTIEVRRNELRNLVVAGRDELYLGTWGSGVKRLLPVSATRQWSALSNRDCLKPVIDTAFTVVQSLDLRGEDLWIATLSDGHTYHLSHLDIRTGAVTCPEFQGQARRVTGVRILSDNLLGVASDVGVHLFRWEKQNGKATGAPLNSLKSDFGEVLGRDVALDSRGRLWALFSEQLGFVDSLQSKLSGGPIAVTFPANVKLKTCRDMETDARRELWIGCDNGLFHVQPGADPNQPEVDHYTTDNGLLANRVLDVAVDKTTGDVWVVSEGGINRLEGPSPPIKSGVSEIKAYPNPFLGKHPVMVLDHLPPGAEAAILTQAGNVVRRFRPSEMLGNQYQWDGTNASGKKVKPGIYFYAVTAGSKSNRGKIIVAR